MTARIRASSRPCVLSSKAGGTVHLAATSSCLAVERLVSVADPCTSLIGNRGSRTLVKVGPSRPSRARHTLCVVLW
ncbi:hypothetical protein B0H12DRAFT_1112079 [Mycena haematopus]|nr:hypothetical protein B0H12DRAFT_1112079 [Mycena haematopus]